MAVINDFKNVKMRSKKYYEYLNLEKEQPEKIKPRLGFYLLVLECITKVKEIDDLIDMIIDTEFRSIVFKDRNNDLGVDAVNIDEEERVIQLFNFKYREKFNNDKGQSMSNMIDVTKFLVHVKEENTDGLDNITKKKIMKIIEVLDSDDTWDIELYMVSNDNVPLSVEDPTINQFKESYGMQIKTIVLDQIVSYISNFPEDMSAKFLVDSTSVMTYEVDELSTRKSYLVKLPLADLIRITCTDKELRNDPGVSYSKLSNQNLEMSLLFDNVRGYLGENTKFNKNIIDTIKNEPKSFFMFNNGLTMTAKNIEAGYKNGNKKFECTINGFQIVNGGQTLRTIYEYSRRNFDEDSIANAEVLVRIFQTESDKQLTNNIAEYTNSQNAISSIDLKSISNLQIQIGAFLESNDILYVRKSGDFGESKKNYKQRISMEKVAQLIYSNMGYPDRATNQKKALFEKYYNEIFNAEKLDFETIITLIDKYYEIEEAYSNLKYEGYHQKYLYIIYLLNIVEDSTIDQSIMLLEKLITDYKKDEQISAPRKLIQKGFKDYIIEKLS
ncbi:AIPR family protein [Enterococcus sp. 1001283B150225_161107_E12]|uniref:AIPR family protein n=1 Tax=Enterococcus sp. 1001283B150225_161107_E12 TaxID=2787145 RepID=UPI00189CDC12|nr:AIPR family protein [Enterococcus sp. 1001283B150225_161107_E12]